MTIIIFGIIAIGVAFMIEGIENWRVKRKEKEKRK